MDHYLCGKATLFTCVCNVKENYVVYLPGGFPEHCTTVAISDKAQKNNIYSVGPKTGVFVLGHKTSLNDRLMSRIN